MTRTVIGVDPSLTRTGVAVWVDGVVSTFSVSTKPADGWRVIRERLIVGAVMPHVRHNSVAGCDWHREGGYGYVNTCASCRMTGAPEPSSTLAVVEAVHMSKFTGRSALDLAGLHDVIVYALNMRGVTVGVAWPQCPKILATGRGNASKPQMVEAAEREFGIEVANTDEADAAWLMAAGVVAGGGTVNGWPHRAGDEWDKARSDALGKVQWVGHPPDPDWLSERGNGDG